MENIAELGSSEQVRLERTLASVVEAEHNSVAAVEHSSAVGAEDNSGLRLRQVRTGLALVLGHNWLELELEEHKRARGRRQELLVARRMVQLGRNSLAVHRPVRREQLNSLAVRKLFEPGQMSRRALNRPGQQERLHKRLAEVRMRAQGRKQELLVRKTVRPEQTNTTNHRIGGQVPNKGSVGFRSWELLLRGHDHENDRANDRVSGRESGHLLHSHRC